MHRDLSSKNVMVDNHGYGKLIDVGLAKKVKENEHTYTIAGTPIYYAPELIKSTGYGHKAEIWALGVLLYELFAGAAPFMPPANSTKKGNARRLELYDKIVKEDPSFHLAAFHDQKTGHMGDAARDLIGRCLRKKASDRVSIPQMRTSVFYQGFNWQAFHNKQIRPPYLPKPNPSLPNPR